MAGMHPLVGYGIAWVVASTLILVAAVLARPLAPRRAATVVCGAVIAIAAIGTTGAPTVPAAVAIDLLLLAGGATLGAAVGARIPEPGHLLPVAWVSALSDVASALGRGGPTAAIVAHERALALLAISVPLPGAGEMVPVIGVGDVVFCALYVAAARRHHLGVGRMVVALAVGLAATLVALVVLRRPIPALPLLGVAVVAAVPAARRMPAGDRRAAVTAMVLVAVLTAALLIAR